MYPSEILHRARQCNCRALCKISEGFNDYIGYHGQMRFYEFLVWDRFQTEYPYCYGTQDLTCLCMISNVSPKKPHSPEKHEANKWINSLLPQSILPCLAFSFFITLVQYIWDLILIITVPADALAPNGARPLAGTGMTTKLHIFFSMFM